MNRTPASSATRMVATASVMEMSLTARGAVPSPMTPTLQSPIFVGGMEALDEIGDGGVCDAGTGKGGQAADGEVADDGHEVLVGQDSARTPVGMHPDCFS